MDQIGQYVIRLTSAALICGAVMSIADKKGAIGVAIKLLAGMFMTFAMISPWVQFRLNDLESFLDDVQIRADRLTGTAENATREEMAKRITDSTAAYILEKAQSLGAEITVEIILDESDIPAPCSVRLNGSVSPYGKQKLSSIIENDLGIPPEEQIWT